jgi:hypothetical protein
MGIAERDLFNPRVTRPTLMERRKPLPKQRPKSILRIRLPVIPPLNTPITKTPFTTKTRMHDTFIRRIRVSPTILFCAHKPVGANIALVDLPQVDMLDVSTVLRPRF